MAIETNSNSSFHQFLIVS